MSGKPLALASALEKMEAWAKHRPVRSNANPVMSSLYIINPFRGSFVTGLFSTHLPTEKRIARLERLAESMGYGTYSPASKQAHQARFAPQSAFSTSNKFPDQ